MRKEATERRSDGATKGKTASCLSLRRRSVAIDCVADIIGVSSARVILASAAVVALWCRGVSAITISIDYTYDTNNFFGAGNPQGATAGAQAKSSLQAAASFYSSILTSSFSLIQTPPPFHSAQFDGQATWDWQMSFTNPATSATTTIDNPTVAANQYIIYAGARSLPGSTAGIGGPGAFSWSVNPTGGFTQQEIDQINATTDTFSSEVEHRGQSSGFADWGGAITFDQDGSTTFFYDHNSQPSGNVTDFYSVALHELAHALGFGTSNEWKALISGSNFTGANAEAQHGGTPVPLSADQSHWVSSTPSVIFGTSTTQETLMDPDITNGTRKLLTELDAAGLKDIGWNLVAALIPGDANGDGTVNSTDFSIMSQHFGQTGTTRASGDFNGDGITNALDFNILATHFGQSAGVPLSAAVPEPAMGGMAVGSILLSIVRRRRARPAKG